MMLPSKPKTCNFWSSIDIIFVGRVVSLTDLRLDEPEGSRQAQERFRSGFYGGKAVIVVDTVKSLIWLFRQRAGK